MDLVDRNFDLDQSGMKQQLQDLNKLMAIANPRLYNYFTEHKSENMYFCFRWLLVWFKREFSLVRFNFIHIDEIKDLNSIFLK